MIGIWAMPFYATVTNCSDNGWVSKNFAKETSSTSTECVYAYKSLWVSDAAHCTFFEDSSIFFLEQNTQVHFQVHELILSIIRVYQLLYHSSLSTLKTQVQVDRFILGCYSRPY